MLTSEQRRRRLNDSSFSDWACGRKWIMPMQNINVPKKYAAALRKLALEWQEQEKDIPAVWREDFESSD